jgi:hypothetical protein
VLLHGVLAAQLLPGRGFRRRIGVRDGGRGRRVFPAPRELLAAVRALHVARAHVEEL